MCKLAIAVAMFHSVVDFISFTHTMYVAQRVITLYQHFCLHDGVLNNLKILLYEVDTCNGQVHGEYIMMLVGSDLDIAYSY